MSEALNQHVVIDGIKRCRKIEQAEQRMITSINRLDEISNVLGKRSLCRMELVIGFGCTGRSPADDR